MRTIVACGLVAALLAGCASAPERVVPTTTLPATGGGTTVRDASGLFAAAFPDSVAQDASLWLNGTLKLQQARSAPGSPLAFPVTPEPVRLDVTDIVPKGVPVILVGDVQTQMTQGSVFLRFAAPRDEFRNGASGPRGASHHLEVGIMHVSDAPVVLELHYRAAEPAPEVPFTLTARVANDPTVARAAFPVGLTLPEGARSFDVELVGERRDFAFDLDTPNLMLWGPDDAFLGHHALASKRATIDLPPDAQAGEYVMILSQGGRSMRLWANGTGPAPLRAMPQTFVVSDARPGATPQRAEWTTDLDRVPILFGVEFAPTTAATAVRVKIDGPDGALMDDRADGPWINAVLPTGNGIGTSFGWDTAYGVPGLDAGSYHALVEMENPAGADPVQAVDYVAFWTR